MADEYAGDIDPEDAWKLLQEDETAVMVDCRTAAEWNYVGFPDLAAANKEITFIEWQNFPAGEPNPNFVDDVKAAGIAADAKVLFLCRSGVRSKSAAIAMTAAGYAACYNISEGFEGNMDDQAHRGSKEGWKVRGLPWKQR